MAIAIQSQTTPMNATDAIWALIQTQAKSVQRDLARRFAALDRAEQVVADGACRRHVCKVSDEELDMCFAGRPQLDETKLADVTKDEFECMAKLHVRKPMKGVEKWL